MIFRKHRRTFSQVYFDSILKQLNKTFTQLRVAAKSLPSAHGVVCPHCKGELKVEERGYVRWTDLELVDDTIVAQTDGWDDMSEDAQGPETLVCLCCERHYAMPDDVSWC